MKLTHTDIRLLTILNEIGGATTGLVTAKMHPRSERDGTRRLKSPVIRRQLLSLQAQGLVGTLDDQKPVCWVRTPAGTAALPSDLR